MAGETKGAICTSCGNPVPEWERWEVCECRKCLKAEIAKAGKNAARGGKAQDEWKFVAFANRHALNRFYGEVA